ncbi:MAG: restriction endonuclease [Candidatus Lambdaproteobacteria bacterium]|nr:restriction endonuclease [Candidatus Lambdaproteobacteria bacterium]
MTLFPKTVYQATITHEALHKVRQIRGDSREIVELKARAQLEAWDEQWAREQEYVNREKEKEANAKRAEKLTEEAVEQLDVLKSLLFDSLEKSSVLNWSALIDSRPFREPEPKPPSRDDPKFKIDLPKPNENDPAYNPKLGILDWLFPSIYEPRKNNAKHKLKNDMQIWHSKNAEIERRWSAAVQMYQHAQRDYAARKELFSSDREKRNNESKVMKERYSKKKPDAIIFYCKAVLSRSQYPDYFSMDFDMDYDEESQILVVDYFLPVPQDFPKTKEVKYLKTKDELRYINLSDKDRNALYDNVLYQIALRTIHEILEADVIDGIKMVVYNGKIKTTDKSTGKHISPCILSVSAEKSKFLEIDLFNVEPKTCFRALKGISGSRLAELAPIPPIAEISREDRRFVTAREVASGIDAATNLAAMDWQDFEHLIRELFEAVFRKGGGEVKVTQASRDGGVDAIAFDPDPIRGGKIVIQAKRYTNTVGVSAVRDLYGTVINEGATKGILVTTSTYGADAYEFAKGKPIQLLTGSNLLALLEEHGHRARIDLQEAKKLQEHL